MKNYLLNMLVFVLAISLFSCQEAADQTKDAAAQTEEAVSDAADEKMDDANAAVTSKNEQLFFGDSINLAGAIPYEVLATKMSNVDSMPAKVIATVDGVCQVKGCWMNVMAKNSTEAEPMFVQFKDYGFFMPLDIAGRKVVMDGYTYRDVTSVEDLRHFAEDEGKSPEEIAKITEPEEELKFLASGVVLLPEGQ